MKGWGNGTRRVDGREAERAGGGGVGRVGEDFVGGEEGRVHEIGGADVDNLAKRVVGVGPRWVAGRRVDALGGLARHVAIDGDVEVVARSGSIEGGPEVERHELQL